MRNVCDYGFIGSRITMPIESLFTPFFEIGGGAGRLSSTPQHSQQLSAHPMLTASGGIHLAATRRIGFDIAYRYFRIFTPGNTVSRSQLYAGIVYRF